jgi:YD repeat-containing protein
MCCPSRGRREHGIALLVNRTVRAWGANGSGQLGDGTGVQRPTPSGAGLHRRGSGCHGHEVGSPPADGALHRWGYNYGNVPAAVAGFTVADNTWLLTDADQDGLTAATEYRIGTDPLSYDTNGDGVDDGTAAALGLDGADPDEDGDGLSYSGEIARGTDPLDADTDGDGHLDGADAFPLDPTLWQMPAPNPDTTPPSSLFSNRPARCWSHDPEARTLKRIVARLIYLGTAAGAAAKICPAGPEEIPNPNFCGGPGTCVAGSVPVQPGLLHQPVSSPSTAGCYMSTTGEPGCCYGPCSFTRGRSPDGEPWEPPLMCPASGTSGGTASGQTADPGRHRRDVPDSRRCDRRPALSRTYDSGRLSQASRYGMFGPGWNSTFDRRLFIRSAQTLEARAADGVPTYYQDPNADSMYELVASPVSDSTVQKTPTGYVRTFRSGAHEDYDLTGRMLSSTDVNGHQTTFARDAQGRLTSVTLEGRTVTLAYQGASTQPVRLLTRRRSGAVLLRSQLPNDTVAYADGTGPPHHTSAGRLLWVTNLAGRSETHEYDAQGRATTSAIGDGQEVLTLACRPPRPPSPTPWQRDRLRMGDGRSRPGGDEGDGPVRFMRRRNRRDRVDL